MVGIGSRLMIDRASQMALKAVAEPELLLLKVAEIQPLEKGWDAICDKNIYETFFFKSSASP